MHMRPAKHDLGSERRLEEGVDLGGRHAALALLPADVDLQQHVGGVCASRASISCTTLRLPTEWMRLTIGNTAWSCDSAGGR